MKRRLSVVLALFVIASMLALPASAQTPTAQVLPERQAPTNLQPVTDADMDGPFAGSTYVPSKQRATAIARYVVRLADAPLAELWLDAQARGAAYDQATAQAYTAGLLAKQAQASEAVAALGGKTLANFTKLINGIAVEISGAKVRDLYAIPGVISVSPLSDYELALDETVPWIGAAAVQSMGYDGTGITVAVLDSGIDYTHAHLGGSGLQADTDQALAEASQPADPDLFPTAKVIGGYDFVGSSWPNTPEIPDPNPMDDEAGLPDGHGTHVSSIIGGVATDDLGPGVAPGVEFYALKICSSVSTSCSGLALLQGMEWAADPDGNGLFDDRADVLNMSLGSNYGQPSDDLSAASETAVALGTVVVASAGNGGNFPYIAGSPSTARSVISVAQTSVPSAVLYRIRRDTPTPVIMDANWQSWSAAPTGPITGDIVYGNGDGTNRLGCDPFTADLTGKVSLIDRGACSVSIKVSNAAAAGAEMAIMALVAPGPPLSFSYGGGDPSVPGFVVTQADGVLLKVDGASVTVDPTDPALTIALLDVMEGTSSRGPAFDVNYVKPNIGAPGASLSASSGDQGYTIFGGTSGAAPMVSGAVAQLLQKAGGSGSLPPVVVKALLMNNAVTDTWQDVPGGMLNPISRQGAGRVDVAASAAAESVAWVPADNDIALSFGFETVADHYADSKTVEVINTSAGEKTYSIEAGFRYADDVDAGVEVMLSADTLTVAAGGAGTFDVDMHVDPTMLKDWTLYGGGTFGAAGGDLLTDVEIDGFLTITADDGEVITLPWHFLPRQAADVMAGDAAQTGPYNFDVPLMNDSMVDGSVEVYPLVDISPEIVVPPGAINTNPADIQYVGVDAIRWSATENLLLFPISTWDSRSHPLEVDFDVYIDVDQDGVDDYVAYNGVLAFAGDPRAVSILVDLAAGTAVAQFFLDTTLNSGVMVIPVVVPDADMAFNFQVFGYDWYITGDLWDMSPANALDGAYHVFDAAAPAFYPDEYYPEVPAGGAVSSLVTGMVNNSPAQIGMLYRVYNGVIGGEAFAVELPVEFFGAVTQTASTSPVVPGTYIDVDVSASNSGDDIADAFFVAPVDPDTIYVEGSAYGGAMPLTATQAAEKGMADLAAGRAPEDVVAVAWAGPFYNGDMVDFGFTVRVMTSSGEVQHDVALFDGATFVTEFVGDALTIVDNSVYPVSRSRRFNADRDTFINGAQPGAYFGDAQTMWTGYFGQMRPLVHTPMDGIPSDAYVDVAYLYLYIVEGRGFSNWSNSVINVETHQVSTEWMPVAVNWTMPWNVAGGDYGPAVGTNHIGSGKINTWLRLDVTDAVSDMLRGASNQGFIITNTDHMAVRYALATKEYWDASKIGYIRVYFRTAN
ncbi:MAG TPA: S8 family serine peptidase [Anaerolineae bacterium]|nr:S8 family serine peptidase [Anaerolineae bacterium]